MSIGTGIAIAGIWASVAAACYAEPIIGFLIAGCAMLATFVIAGANAP